jgi:hypothetical protein
MYEQLHGKMIDVVIVKLCVTSYSSHCFYGKKDDDGNENKNGSDFLCQTNISSIKGSKQSVLPSNDYNQRYFVYKFKYFCYRSYLKNHSIQREKCQQAKEYRVLPKNKNAPIPMPGTEKLF